MKEIKISVNKLYDIFREKFASNIANILFK